LADSGAVDAALVAKLAADATLLTLCPDGVFFDVSASGKTRFVVVSLSTSHDEPMEGARAYEETAYLVKAVDLNSSSVNARAAAARIDALLDGQPLTISGYKHMLLSRVERVRYTEVDPDNNDTRWQHQGGLYECWVSQ